LAVAEVQSRQPAELSEDRRDDASTTDATLHDVRERHVAERCSRRLFEPSHVAAPSLDNASAAAHQQNARRPHHGHSVATADDTSTSAAAAAAAATSSSWPQLHGH